MGVAAVVAATVLGLVILYQVALAAGAPVGRAAWGGRYRVLPPTLRGASLAAAAVLGAAAWMVLARADLVHPGADATSVRVLVWVFAGLFMLNTLGNLASRSPAERWVMTPATLLLSACFVAVALWG